MRNPARKNEREKQPDDPWKLKVAALAHKHHQRNRNRDIRRENRRIAHNV
jgi:hypothetical protein